MGQTPAVLKLFLIQLLLFCFSKWGMSYGEIEKLTPNEILIADFGKTSFVNSEKVMRGVAKAKPYFNFY